MTLLRPGQGLGGQSPLYAVHGGGGGPLRIKMALLPSVKTMNLGQWEPHHPGPPDSGPSPAWPPRGCFGPGPIAQASGWVSNMGSETWRLLGDDWSYTLCSWGTQGLQRDSNRIKDLPTPAGTNPNEEPSGLHQRRPVGRSRAPSDPWQATTAPSPHLLVYKMRLLHFTGQF